MRVLVLGGAGFLGRHVAEALTARGHDVVIGSRCKGATEQGTYRRLRFEERTHAGAWRAALEDVDAVVNCVGILRERGHETYDRVHHLAPAALAFDCARGYRRFVHVSALGLDQRARSGFIRSKLAAEDAIRASGADYAIVRPSLLDGEGGFGARWLRAVARWPVHFVPSDATGRIAVVSVSDVACAIAKLCEVSGARYREVELGGLPLRTLSEHLAALRALVAPRAARVVRVPAWLARLASHACDLLHFSPFSYGHLELLRRDNVPRTNALAGLLGYAPRVVGAEGGFSFGRESASAPDRATLPPTAARGGGNTRIARAP